MYSRKQLESVVEPEALQALVLALDTEVAKERHQKALRYISDILPDEAAMTLAVKQFWVDEGVRKEKLAKAEKDRVKA